MKLYYAKKLLAQPGLCHQNVCSKFIWSFYSCCLDLRDKVASKGLDVWSLGCTLFWLISGQKVFREPKPDLRRAITTKQPDLSPIADPDARDLLSVGPHTELFF